MVDAIVSTGANIVDQDFFEALGFSHYIAGDEYKYGAGDADLRELMIDRIYDTLHRRGRAAHLRRDHPQDHQLARAAALQLARVHPRDGRVPRQERQDPAAGWRATRIVLAAYEKDVPIFCPAFSDCSAGFGLVAHQHARQATSRRSRIDSAKDFYELTQLKIANPTTGLL